MRKVYTLQRIVGVLVAMVALAAFGSGCSDSDYSGGSDNTVCGQGEVVVSDGENYCVFSPELIIEGFACPMGLDNPHYFDEFLLCAPGSMLPDGLDNDLRADGYNPEPPSMDDGSGGNSGSGSSCVNGATADDECGNTCLCEDGQWSCTLIGCDNSNGTSNGSDGMNDGTCIEGTVTTQGCNTCSCSGGEMLCTLEDCDPEPDVLDNVLPVDMSCPDNITGAGFDLNNPNIDGDILTFEVGYSGGCEEHTFRACWYGEFLESFPVQTNLWIFHENNNDGCEAFITRDLSVNLSPLREGYQSGYQTENGTIIVHLRESDANVDYSF